MERLRYGWLALLMCLALGIAMGALAAATEPTLYGATSSVVASPAEGFLDPQNADKLPLVAATVAKLLSTTVVSEEVGARLRSDGMVQTPAWIRGHLSAQVEAQSPIIRITATTGTQASATRLAAAAAATVTAFVDQRATNPETIGPPVPATSTDPSPNAAKITNLATRTNGQVSPRVARNLALGGCLGLIAGVAAAAWLGDRRRRISNPTEIAGELGAPLLAALDEATDPAELTQNAGIIEARLRLEALARGASHGVVIVLVPHSPRVPTGDLAHTLRGALVASGVRSVNTAGDITGPQSNGAKASQRMHLGESIEILRVAYDVSIIDAAPPMQRADILPFADIADLTVFCVAPHLRRQQLRAARAALDGLSPRAAAVLVT